MQVYKHRSFLIFFLQVESELIVFAVTVIETHFYLLNFYLFEILVIQFLTIFL